MKTLQDQRITDLQHACPQYTKPLHLSYTNEAKTYIDDRNLMPTEQKGCCRGSKGHKVKLLISTAILQEYKSRDKMVCMA